MRKLWQAGLAGAKELARATLCEVEFSELEAVLGADHGVKAGFGGLVELGAGEQNAVAFGGAAAHASAQLVQLGKAETLGVIDHHDRCVGYVDTDFDDRGGDEDVGFAALETAHGHVLVVRRHAAVQQAQAQAVEWAGAEFFVHVGGGAEFWFGKEWVLLGFAFGFRGWNGHIFAGLFRLGRGEIELGLIVFGAFNDGVNDVGLVAGGDLLPHEFPLRREPCSRGCGG